MSISGLLQHSIECSAGMIGPSLLNNTQLAPHTEEDVIDQFHFESCAWAYTWAAWAGSMIKLDHNCQRSMNHLRALPDVT